MSSVRPEIRSIRMCVRPQEHGSVIRREMSPRPYRMTGNASFVIVVKTSSPVLAVREHLPRLGVDDLGMK